MSSIDQSTNENCIVNGVNFKDKIRIAFVGDVHGDWDLVADEIALKYLNVDLCLFVGDFGEEDLDLVSQIARLNHPRAVILGNHDCWWTRSAQQLIDPKQNGRSTLRAQLDCLGDLHVGYTYKSFPHLNLTVVGVRPFSQGGKWNNSNVKILDHLYGISSSEQSTSKIVETVRSVPYGQCVIIMGHNGPSGLGDKPYDICGADFLGGGDWGDCDLEAALDCLRSEGRSPALVAFGHMHDKLRFGGQRRMIQVDKSGGTIYLNTAFVRRVQRPHGKGISSKTISERQFCVVEMTYGEITGIKNQWVLVKDRKAQSIDSQDDSLLRMDEDGNMFIYDEHFDKLRQVREECESEEQEYVVTSYKPTI